MLELFAIENLSLLLRFLEANKKCEKEILENQQEITTHSDLGSAAGAGPVSRESPRQVSGGLAERPQRVSLFKYHAATELRSYVSVG